MYDHDEIVLLTRQGLSAAQIADRLGCSTRQVQRVRTRRGVAQPIPEHSSKPITAERLAAIERMVADGVSHREIARTLGASWLTISRYFPGTGWTPQEAGEYSSAVRRANELLRRAA